MKIKFQTIFNTSKTFITPNLNKGRIYCHRKEISQSLSPIRKRKKEVDRKIPMNTKNIQSNPIILAWQFTTFQEPCFFCIYLEMRMKGNNRLYP